MRLNSKSGFSLVELMVVVAIIGILATIAVPNFQKFQARAKQTNARVELTGIYTAQKSFYTEFSMYHTYLNYVGYVPDGCPEGVSGNAVVTCAAGNPRYYSVGFGAAGNVAPVPGIPIPSNNARAFANNVGAARTIATAAAVETDGQAFIAGAAGNPGGSAQDDWRINESRQLVNEAAAASSTTTTTTP